ncbi:MAG: hypothetical protein QW350_04060 [Candidatus Aenigmatarchaeota archaeon]
MEELFNNVQVEEKVVESKKRIYLLSINAPKKAQIEDLNKNYGDIEIVETSPEIKKFWLDIDNEVNMTCNEFCKRISEVIEDIKIKDVDIAWIEGDSFITRILFQELKPLNIPVIYSVREIELEEMMKEDGTIVDIVHVKHIRFHELR